MSAPVDYATSFGISSFAAPVVFAILYAPLFAFFLHKSVGQPIYIYIVLTLFCAIRVTAFSLRAALARDLSDADNLDVLLAYEILYNTGFFGLLYSTFSLVTRRVDLVRDPPNDPISRILRHHFLFRIALAAAVAIGITGAVESSSGFTSSAVDTGDILRRVAIYVFFVCSILVLLQTFILARTELSEGGYPSSARRLGTTYGIYILVVISALLVAREAFFTATATKATVQNNEAIWYPLAVVTEFLAVVLFAVPGLVPDAKESQ